MSKNDHVNMSYNQVYLFMKEQCVILQGHNVEKIEKGQQKFIIISDL